MWNLHGFNIVAVQESWENACDPMDVEFTEFLWTCKNFHPTNPETRRGVGIPYKPYLHHNITSVYYNYMHVMRLDPNCCLTHLIRQMTAYFRQMKIKILTLKYIKMCQDFVAIYRKLVHLSLDPLICISATLNMSMKHKTQIDNVKAECIECEKS